MKVKYIFIIFFLFIFSANAQFKKYDKTLKLMGSRFDISVIADSPERWRKIHSRLQFQKSKELKVSFLPGIKIRKLSLINQNAGIQPVKVSNELFDLINRSLQISKITRRSF